MSLSTVTSSTTGQSTPIKRTPVAATNSPGNWKHPRLAEITRRQSRSVLSDKNVKTILYNVAALALLLVLRSMLDSKPVTSLLSASLRGHLAWGYRVLQAIPVVNIGIALLPLVRGQDNLSDIPLTPAQRKLLGLPPDNAFPTPNLVYSTPPKYSRTPSFSGSGASNKSHASRPASGNSSPASDRRMSGSPYSPVTASPLLHKAVAGAVGGVRTSSFGSPSSTGHNTSTGLPGENPVTPTASTGKRSSVSLNNKWLFEKGRRGSNSTFLL